MALRAECLLRRSKAEPIVRSLGSRRRAVRAAGRRQHKYARLRQFCAAPAPAGPRPCGETLPRASFAPMDRQLSLLESQQHLQATPAVSILVRTMGRASLAQAIDSVREQSFTDWEIVVLNAGGEAIDPMPSPAGGKLRVLTPGGRIERARAANLLLEAAAGEFALFLDDDDWLLPDHIAKLVDALRAQPDLAGAYGDVEAVTGARTGGRQTVHVFCSDFDPVALQLQNYLPIHAVLFRMDAVRRPPPCRFDETMSLFEDWDFWLQLVAKGALQRVPGVSAVYAYEAAEGSSHGEAGPRREQMLAVLGARQLARWQPQDVARLVERDAARTNLLNESRQRADAATWDAQALKANFEAARKWSSELQDALASSHMMQRQQQQEIERGQREIERLQREIVRVNAEARSAMEAHAVETARQQRELQVLAHVREELLSQIAEIQASTSWRITRPLRGAGRLAKALRERARVFGNVARTVRQQVRQHGSIGFARRLPFYLRRREEYLSRVAGVPPGAMCNPFAAAATPLRDLALHPELLAVTDSFDVKVSVVIPTLNAGVEFEWLLRKLRAQRGVREVQIVVVDSGSRDDTVAVAAAAGAKVVRIEPSEFTHSYSRNVGAEAAEGDYLLFMVQDAYPIGEWWLYGMVRFLRDPAHQRLAAVSCSESSRSDSDLMYDAMIDTHYRFLECREQDRVGRHRGDDHMSLRSQGQLSDVSCLIGRELFAQYRYRGDYAEDLDLGIRLIKDDWQVAMLASVKVVHSHNRAAYYYLKRSFVDVQFLVGLFGDFTYPRCDSLAGLVAGIASAAVHVSSWLADIGDLQRPLTGARWRESLARWRQDLQTVQLAGAIALSDERLEAFVRELPERFGVQTDGQAAAQVRQFSEMLMGRLEHFSQYAAQVYDDADELPRAELAAVLAKTFAATAGSALGFYCLDQRKEAGGAQRQDADAIHRELTAGV
jgi:O-antigen biosynthesis protein